VTHDGLGAHQRFWQPDETIAEGSACRAPFESLSEAIDVREFVFPNRERASRYVTRAGAGSGEGCDRTQLTKEA